MNAAPTGARGYIGGGNIAGILGVSPYKSPLDEYLVITNPEPEVIPPERQAFFKRRKALEPFAAEVFSQVTGLAIVARNQAYHDRALPFLRAEIDFEVSDGGNGETKTVHPLALREWGDSGTDDIPTYVLAQVQHGLGLTNRHHAWVHALVGLDDDRIYRIERDQAVIDGMRAHATTFWHAHVMPRVPPPPTTLEDLRLLYPTDSGRVLEADESLAWAVAELKRVKAAAKAIETDQEELEARIKLEMRDATAIAPPGGGKPLLTWKAQTAVRFDGKAFAAAHPDLAEEFSVANTFRVLRVK